LLGIVLGGLYSWQPQSQTSLNEQLNEEITQTEIVTDITQTDNYIDDATQIASKRLYRSSELSRIIGAMLAGKSMLVAGELGIGKSTLANAVVEKLRTDGFQVVFLEPVSPKQMLIKIAEQLGIDTQSIEGKLFSAERLKLDVKEYVNQKTAFLVIDNAHSCPLQFRLWLRELSKNTPILLFATNPPRTDVFISIPRIELTPLPDYAIRELMEQAALDCGINLKTSDLAKLQERVGGNPLFATRAIAEEHLGLEVEAGDHQRYFDMTPIIMLVGIVFVVMRFMALGTGNPALYVFTGSVGALFMGLSYVMRALPKEGRRIR
jgi:AAA domain